jgi:hypothetical protein
MTPPAGQGTRINYRRPRASTRSPSSSLRARSWSHSGLWSGMILSHLRITMAITTVRPPLLRSSGVNTEPRKLYAMPFFISPIYNGTRNMSGGGWDHLVKGRIGRERNKGCKSASHVYRINMYRPQSVEYQARTSFFSIL